jgi:membrane-associated phospholipid phosphatase
MPAFRSLITGKASCTPARLAAAVVLLGFLTSCAPDQSAPTEPTPRANASRQSDFSHRDLASPGWQQTARNLVAQAAFSPLPGGRAYAILSVAQYLAVQRAEASIRRDGFGEGSARHEDDNGSRHRRATERGAVAGASVVTLSYLFPTQMQALEDTVSAQASVGTRKQQRAFAAGEAIGRAVGAEMVTRATGDHFNDPNTAVPPVGPGFWTSSAVPPLPVAGGTLPGTTPWFLNSASQFRPGPPPAFGSPTFNAALAEIRQISDTRTADQIAIATFWAFNPGTITAPGFWLSVPTDSGWAAQHDFSEREMTHFYALASATMFDATIGCWDAKLTYWLIRPWRADPAITTLATVGKPNHPSYPSGHSCSSSAAAEVLAAFFPEKRVQLDAMVVQAGLSRMYAGIHYRFDIEAGQALGRSVAHFTIAADASGRSVLTPRHRRGDGEHEGEDGQR